MKKKYFTFALLAVMTVGVVTGCNSENKDNESVNAAPTAEVTKEPVEITEEPDQSAEILKGSLGKVEGQVYEHKKIGFRINFPKNWTVLNYEDTLEKQMKNAQTVYGSVDELKSALETGGIDYLVYANDEVSKEGTANNFYAQSCSKKMANSSAKDLLEATTEQLSEAFKEYGERVTKLEIEEMKVDGVSVYKAGTTVLLDGEINGKTFDNYNFGQYYYAFEKNDVIVIGGYSFYNESGKEAFQTLLDSLSFIE